MSLSLRILSLLLLTATARAQVDFNVTEAEPSIHSTAGGTVGLACEVIERIDHRNLFGPFGRHELEEALPEVSRSQLDLAVREHQAVMTR